MYIYSFICSFHILIHVYSFTYTHSYTHLRILIHILISYTHSCILIHILIYVYSFIYSFTYTHPYTHSHIHSRILIHVYSFIYSFTYTHSYNHSCILILIFLSLNESILLRNWNYSNWIIQNKVMTFSCQLVNLPITLGTVCITHFFRGSNFMFDTLYLCSFKAKVLRVLFQLESPNLEHRNSSYVRNNPDYSMIKTETEFGLYMATL